MHIEILRATPSDLQELLTLGRQTFFESFAWGNSEENMHHYLDTEFTVEKLKREISDPGSEFYLARSQNKFIGYLKINTGQAQTELKESHGLEVERIYVLKEFQGRQTGQILFDKALARAKEKNREYIWLGVWEKNAKAIRFYEKNGLIPFGTHGFKVGKDEQNDILMKRVLIS